MMDKQRLGVLLLLVVVCGTAYIYFTMGVSGVLSWRPLPYTVVEPGTVSGLQDTVMFLAAFLVFALLTAGSVFVACRMIQGGSLRWGVVAGVAGILLFGMTLPFLFVSRAEPWLNVHVQVPGTMSWIDAKGYIDGQTVITYTDGVTETVKANSEIAVWHYSLIRGGRTIEKLDVYVYNVYRGTGDSDDRSGFAERTYNTITVKAGSVTVFGPEKYATDHGVELYMKDTVFHRTFTADEILSKLGESPPASLNFVVHDKAEGWVDWMGDPNNPRGYGMWEGDLVTVAITTSIGSSGNQIISTDLSGSQAVSTGSSWSSMLPIILAVITIGGIVGGLVLPKFL
jgi:uncharacterized membrane protein (DUF485 family)